MSPLSASNSGFRYPEPKVTTVPPASVTAYDAVADGVAAAPEEAPVTVFAPLKAT